MSEITKEQMIEWLKALDEGATIWDTELPIRDAIIAHLEKPDDRTLPEGWQAVPITPTYEMVCAGGNCLGHWAWKPMLAAAPKIAKQPNDE